MARGGHGFSKALLGFTMPYPSIPCGKSTLKWSCSHFRGGLRLSSTRLDIPGCTQKIPNRRPAPKPRDKKMSTVTILEKWSNGRDSEEEEEEEEEEEHFCSGRRFHRCSEWTKALLKWVANDRPLWLFSRDHFISRTSRLVCESAIFEYLILITIIANCVVMAMEVHLPNLDTTPANQRLDKSENFFIGIFCAEFALKTLGLGFVLHRDSYLRSWWNVLDFVVVATGIFSLLGTVTQTCKNGRFRSCLAPATLCPAGGQEILEIQVKISPDFRIIRKKNPLISKFRNFRSCSGCYAVCSWIQRLLRI
jgi:hypothetical protein